MAQKGNAAELGTENIRKLLVQYAVPAIIAMTASSLYNMVDRYFYRSRSWSSGYFRSGHYLSAHEPGCSLWFTGRRRSFHFNFSQAGTERLPHGPADPWKCNFAQRYHWSDIYRHHPALSGPDPLFLPEPARPLYLMHATI